MSTAEKKLVPVKKAVENQEESTEQVTFFKPDTDITESANELKLYMDMPGVSKKDVRIKLEKNLLSIEGQIDLKRYQNLKTQYAEYNIGHYRRSFQLSSQIDQEKIQAQMNDGVLELSLPKAEEAKPKQIQVS